MSDNIPFEMQSEIIKKLPIKSLLKFRTVSKQWKALIDSPDFIKNYPTPQKHHLLVWYETDTVRTYTSIVDDNNNKNTFPQQKFPLTAPAPLNLLRLISTLGSVNGLICFYGLYQDITYMAVLWNPSIKKCVGIVIPNVEYSPHGGTVIGFGVCSDTCDPKLVKVKKFRTRSFLWEVQVFTLSSRVWKTVYSGAPFKSCDLMLDHAFIDGVIYWGCLGRSFLISFDLKSEKLGEVCLPERLVCGKALLVAKVNESLGLLEYGKEGEIGVCGVWMRNGGVDQPFTKIYTVKVEGKSLSALNGSVLGFRNNGEVVLNMVDDDYKESTVEVYEPSSGRMSSVGIRGDSIKFFATSYMETLLLLDEANSIIE